jgi:hypothetical protein
MAASVGSLSVFLSLNASGFSKGIDSARKHLGQFSKDFGGIKSLLAGGLGALGISLTAAAFTGMVKEQLKAIDATAKLADSMGTTTEQLSAFRAAAGMAGVDAPDKMIEALTKKIGEARQGSAEAAKQFAVLGVNVNDLASMDSVAAFAAVADGINRLGTASDKAGVASKLFGDQGVKAGAFWATASTSIAEARAQADALGTSLSRVDAARVEIANDAMARVTTAITGMKEQITVALAPAIAAVAEQMLGWLNDTGGAAGNANKALEFTIKIIGKIADYANFALAVFHSIRATLGLIATGALIIGNILMKVWLKPIELVQGALSELLGNMALVASKIPGIGDGIASALQAGANFTGAVSSGAAAAQAFGDDLVESMAIAGIEAGEAALDAFDRFDRGVASAGIENWIDTAKAKSDAAAKAIADGVKTGAGAALTDTIATATAAGIATGAEQVAADKPELFNPGRLGAATFGSVEGFRAQSGLVNPQVMMLEKQQLTTAQESERHLREIADATANTVTVTF